MITIATEGSKLALLDQRRASVDVSDGERPLTHAAFEALYLEYYRDVYRYVLVRTGHRHDAEDVTNETFERAFRTWGGNLPDQPALPWLFLTARRLTTDRWRRARRFVLERLDTALHDVAATTRAESEVSDWLETLAKVLSTRQREAVLLRYQRDLSDADIAAVMGLTPSGVRSLVARAVATLRDHPEVWK